MAMLAMTIDRRLAAPMLLVALAVASSRVYLGVHWPLDVLAGACWGTAAGAIGVLAARRITAGRRQARARAEHGEEGRPHEGR